MIQLLKENPLLLLFLVAAIGYPIGRIRIRGSSLGVSAVLFTGLAVGSIHPDLKLPEIIYMLGLALFAYTIGLSSGTSFVASLKREGLRNNAMIAVMLVVAAGITLFIGKVFHFKSAIMAGMFAGSFTNTPALAGALETIHRLAPKETVNQLLAEPVIGYSIAYPFGVIGTIFAIFLAQKIWKINYEKESKSLHMLGASNEPLHSRTVLVKNLDATGISVNDFNKKFNAHVMFGRIKRNNNFFLADSSTVFEPDDLVAMAGADDDLNLVAQVLGKISEEEIQYERSQFDFRRLFVSNHKIVGLKLKNLHLGELHGAIITRIRRGDDDFLPHGDMALEAGDRVRVIAPRSKMTAVGEFFGDSYRAVSEVDILTFSFGLALGLLLGLIPVPLPGGITFKLGFAGGPLFVALILGIIRRTGKFIWTIPYSANITLRQIGLVFFLAGIGTRAGYGFVSTFTDSGGIYIFTAGVVLTFSIAIAALWMGHRLLHIPMSLLTGMVAGLFTQPAVLGYAMEQTKNDLPNVGYASVYPVAMIMKILLVQVLLSF
jgi:putative transport protein